MFRHRLACSNFSVPVRREAAFVDPGSVVLETRLSKYSKFLFGLKQVEVLLFGEKFQALVFGFEAELKPSAIRATEPTKHPKPFEKQKIL